MATKTKNKDAAARKRSEASKKAAETRRRNAEEEKKSPADLVRDTAANPDASLVGREQEISSPDSPLKVVVVDGARARLELDKHDVLSQADLIAARKLLDGAIAQTY